MSYYSNERFYRIKEYKRLSGRSRHKTKDIKAENIIEVVKDNDKELGKVIRLPEGHCHNPIEEY
jgi:hypothetical protein